MRVRLRAGILFGILLAATSLLAGAASAQFVSFAGKQIKILIGFSPTGFAYDTYGRLLARHLGKYLPGNPIIVPQNRPGAGPGHLAHTLFTTPPQAGTENTPA